VLVGLHKLSPLFPHDPDVTYNGETRLDSYGPTLTAKMRSQNVASIACISTTSQYVPWVMRRYTPKAAAHVSCHGPHQQLPWWQCRKQSAQLLRFCHVGQKGSGSTSGPSSCLEQRRMAQLPVKKKGDSAAASNDCTLSPVPFAWLAPECPHLHIPMLLPACRLPIPWGSG
jgi:hypothetical protein